jgi:hypothetical protein
MTIKETVGYGAISKETVLESKITIRNKQNGLYILPGMAESAHHGYSESVRKSSVFARTD